MLLVILDSGPLFRQRVPETEMIRDPIKDVRTEGPDNFYVCGPLLWGKVRLRLAVKNVV